ncbi:hypothetical protein HYN56_14255 [Flavobacterium crocinum]|uniref:Uncharacterized protein n=1 Tax=Flavobacterium crocinum TaxID=2183896 RepID=A0A2S1YMM3_9FLAO|nr:hypothetical protein HYN56_14255 [Flavobacterium crocinum]
MKKALAKLSQIWLKPFSFLKFYHPAKAGRNSFFIQKQNKLHLILFLLIPKIIYLKTSVTIKPG